MNLSLTMITFLALTLSAACWMPSLANSSNISQFNQSCIDGIEWHRQKLIDERLGPSTPHPLPKLLISLVYSFILLTGTIGNITTCILIIVNRSLHTRTDFYLFSLAASDLLLLTFGLSFELSETIVGSRPWRLGNGVCKAQKFLSELGTLVSITVLTIFTFERYLCICHPRMIGCCSILHHRLIAACSAVVTKRRDRCDASRRPRSTNNCSRLNAGGGGFQFYEPSVKSCLGWICFAWAFGALFASPIAGLAEVGVQVTLPSWAVYEREVNDSAGNKTDFCVDDGPGMNLTCPTLFRAKCRAVIDSLWIEGQPIQSTMMCTVMSKTPLSGYLDLALLFKLWTVFFLGIPILLMSILYTRIALHLRRSTRLLRDANGQSNCPESVVVSRRKGVTRMVVVIVVTFFICWAPFHLQRVLSIEQVRPGLIASTIIFYVSGSLFYCNATVNPILYHLMSTRFRRAFLQTFGRYCCCRCCCPEWRKQAFEASRMTNAARRPIYRSDRKRQLGEAPTVRGDLESTTVIERHSGDLVGQSSLHHTRIVEIPDIHLDDDAVDVVK